LCSRLFSIKVDIPLHKLLNFSTEHLRLLRSKLERLSHFRVRRPVYKVRLCDWISRMKMIDMYLLCYLPTLLTVFALSTFPILPTFPMFPSFQMLAKMVILPTVPTRLSFMPTVRTLPTLLILPTVPTRPIFLILKIVPTLLTYYSVSSTYFAHFPIPPILLNKTYCNN
jgi:hypothetical protein